MPVLYIVATPIGNLSDVGARALETLKQADLILCEDTRVTKKLLCRFAIAVPTLSYHQHSKLAKLEYIRGLLEQGKNLALVSDAGTPSISDPGGELIAYLLRHLPDLKIVAIPGPSALIAALSVAGFSADRFVFLGFPPHKKKRKKFFQEVAAEKYTVVFYESPYRILKTLEELGAARDAEVVVCRELTKKFETVYRGRIPGVIRQIKADKVKGEFVVVVGKNE